MSAKAHWWLVPLVLWSASYASTAAAQSARSNPRAGIDFYLQTYGRVPAAELPDVYAVFEKVRATADKSSLVTPQLVVIGDAKQASAFSLSDGTIFLSTKALAIIRESVTPSQAQARLAFVLGHELAHLASNDLWDNQISQALLESSTAREVGSRELAGVLDTSAGQQKQELKADDLGFIYAALAGFEVDGLLETNGANEDFLSFWNSKAGKRNDPNYPQPAQRAGLLRLRLKEMRDSLQYFEFGSRLMHFGRYREAIDFFREFQRQFPGRELFNNIGYCHLRIAVGQLDPDYAYRYWLPMVSDLDTALANLTVRSAEFSVDRKQWRMSAAARESLLQAARYFERAIDKDAAYAPSYVNLATTQLLLGLDPGDTRLQIADGNNLLRAKMAITSALKMQPDDSQTKVLATIIDFESQTGKPSDRSLALPANLDANDPTVLYNFAQLTSFDATRSARYWQQLANQFDSLPRKMQATICRRHNRVNIPSVKSQCESVANNSVNAKIPWALPIKLSRDLLEVPLTESELRQNAWKKTSLGSSVAFVGNANAALAVDDIVTLVVLKPPSTGTESLVQCCSQPVEKIPVVNGVLWHYGRWIALVREQRVDEIWFSN